MFFFFEGAQEELLELAPQALSSLLQDYHLIQATVCIAFKVLMENAPVETLREFSEILGSFHFPIATTSTTSIYQGVGVKARANCSRSPTLCVCRVQYLPRPLKRAATGCQLR